MSASAEPEGVIERALQTARELTGLDLAFVGQFSDGRELIRRTSGDPSRFGFPDELDLPLEITFCQRMIDGRIANYVADTKADPSTADMPVNQALGAYLGVPLRRSDGSLYGTFCCASRDAHQGPIGDEHIRLMETLARLVGDQLDRLEAADAADRMQREFFTAMTHDLRTPLTVIKGYAEELAEGAPSDEVARDWGERILRNADRLDTLIDDVLLLARAGSGALEARVEPTDLAAIVGDAARDAGPAATRGGVRIGVEAPDALELSGDPRQLRRVLDNLLSNAIKCSPGGGPVAVRLRTEDSTAVLEVADEGIGVPEPEIAHLFDRFYRASTARALELPGSGLGLAISQSIVAAHEGTIAIESEVGRGTTVRVRLPRARR